jgi:tRNA pseudouridine38-40 synthase
MSRIALGLEYDGAAHAGWQSQHHRNTVQDHLEAAVSKVAGEPIRLACAGRTDAGVHALIQVAHFDVASRRPISAWVRGVNAHLPSSIGVRWACAVPEEFHARFKALSRHYVYVLHNHRSRPALFSGKVGWFHAPLDAEAMQAAAGYLVGEHDFSSFRSSLCQAKSAVKHLYALGVRRTNDTLWIHAHGSAFLHHMVRNIVGALVHIGKGAAPPEWMEGLRDRRDRTLAPPTFSPAGLYLRGVEYDPVWQLPQNGRIIADFPFLE